MTFDFGALPPEINSTRMYTGPGAGPMLSAAAAWNNIAAELNTTASASRSVISTLTDDELGGLCRGGDGHCGRAICGVDADHCRSRSTRSQPGHGVRGRLRGCVCDDVSSLLIIVANRVQLAALVATNILGQNTPAIAATEAHYGEMWAQDAAAMYGYAGWSASAGKLEPLSDPASTTDPGGLSGQAAAVAHAAGTSAGLPGLVSGLPGAMQSLSTPLSGAAVPASALSDFFSNSLVENIPNGIFDMAAWNGFNGIVTGILYAHTADAGLMAHSFAPAFGGVGLVPPAPGATATGVAGVGGSPVLAGMGQASPVGKLSVPAGWSAAAPAEPVAAAPLAGSGWTAPVEESGGMNTVSTGMPAYASTGRGGYGTGPRYGVKPTVMPKHVLV